MYFRAFVSVPVFAVTFDSVAGVNFQLDYDCIHAKCATELMECARDADTGSLTDVKRSYCQSVASCIHQDIVNELADPDSCLDGVDHSNMSPIELKVESCIRSQGCAVPKVDAPLKKGLPILSINTVKEDCMAQKCTAALAPCNEDAVCKNLFECLDLHRDGEAAKCVSHLDRIDGTQKAALECGWSNKCFAGSYKPTGPAASDATALNPIPAAPQTVTPLSRSPALETKSSFMEVKPISFLSLQTASEAELKAAAAQAEKQAKAAEAAWEQSRKNTDSLLARVHDEIKALNEDLDKTSTQEKKDLALLEDTRKKEDAELEATEKKLRDLANTKVTVPSSSFLEGFNSDDFLAPLRRAAQQAREFAKQIKEHSFFKKGASSSFLESHDDKASKALSLAEAALKKLDSDIAAQKKQLAEEEEKAKKEEQEAEARASTEFAEPASFLELGTLGDLKAAAAAAERQAKSAEAAWEASRKKTQSLLSKVHTQIDSLNTDLDKAMARDRTELSMLEENRKKEDAELEATEEKLKELTSHKVELPAASFLEKSSSNLDEILAPLRKAAEDAKHFAEEMRGQRSVRMPSALIQTGGEEDKASKALSLAEAALKKLDEDIAAQKKELVEEEEKAKKEGFAPVDEETAEEPVAASFLQTGNGFDPLSPQALADWRDRFELQLQKAREAAGIHSAPRSAFVQTAVTGFADNEQLREDERQVERLEGQFNQQMQKLKEDNAELLARAKEEMERAKEEESKVKRQLSQASLLETGQKYDPAKEEAHIRELERKWVREAENIVTPPHIVQQDNELQAMIEQQKVREAEAEAQLDQMKQKLNKDIEIMHRDLAASSVSGRPASFLQTSVKGPAEAALARAEADLQKLKSQLREETAKLNAMHFD